ncbi:MAG: alpha-galactosidase [Solirubrobacteraceae bacterium]
MISEETLDGSELRWSDAALQLLVAVGDDGVPRLSSFSALATGGESGAHPRVDTGDPDDPDGTPAGLPLVDILSAGTGRQWVSQRYSESVLGSRLRYAGHEQHCDGAWSVLQISLQDPLSGLGARAKYAFLTDAGVVRSSVTVRNAGDAPLTIDSVSSFLGSCLAGPDGELADVDIFWAENDWQAEARWRSRSFRDALPALTGHLGAGRSRGRFAVTGVGTWSSGGHLPMGAVVNRRTGHTMLWQIEHNGAWHWQLGEHMGAGPTTSYLSLLGPTDIEHQWSVTLAPGEEFESVPVAVAVSANGLEDAVARMTRYRRAIRRPHPDTAQLPVIFNDYLNTINADPSAQRLTPLIKTAAELGAECFCIDAGWYAEPGEPWWDAVGEWRPSVARFPDGFHTLIELIRSEGMVPGVWIEPEVIGVRSPVADTLPTDAFFTRGGERIAEQGRYQLDLRHPAARAHLDQTIDFLADELGVGYLKFDYNINVAPGTDAGGLTAGAGMLAHNRAFLAWVEGLLDRHPGLSIESCASGGMRTDYATLSRFQLHSTSDQEDPLLYPPIAAASPLAVLPEQAAVWAAVQPAMDRDLIAFTLCGAMLGRVHLSGHVDSMSVAQQQLVAEAISVYKRFRGDLRDAIPFWPLGLPGWTDPWLALGMRGNDSAYVVVWRRDVGTAQWISLPLAAPGTEAKPRVLYPQPDPGCRWDATEGELHVSLPHAPSACLIAFDTSLPARPRNQIR